MPVNERTYSFRASADFPERTRDAFSTWSQLLSTSAVETGSWEESQQRLWYAFVRHYLRVSDEEADNQSALLRRILEAFVSSAESVASDRAYVDQYRDWREQDDDGVSVREGVLSAAATRWLDD